MSTKTERTSADSLSGERSPIGGAEEGAGRLSRGLVWQEAVAGARVHQEVLGRNGVPPKDEVTACELSRKWPRATLECQPGTGRAAVAGSGAKPLVIITNVWRCGRVRRVEWQSWGRAVPGDAAAQRAGTWGRPQCR